MNEDIYERLAAPFDVVHTDVRGGVSLTYVTGEQVTRRLNDVLGVAGWDFRVLAHDIHAEADEAWALGELTARIDGVTITKQQFGSQKVRRSRSSGAPLDLGFDLKGASTDALKKCATLIGVGLYLSNKDQQQPQRQQRPQQQRAQSPQPIREAAPPPKILCQAVVGEKDGQKQTCGTVLEAVDDAGLLWSAVDLANNSQAKFKRPFCWTHYQQAVSLQQRAS